MLYFEWEKEEVNWGLPVPRTGSRRLRQEDCVPLHPLLIHAV